MRFWVGDGLVAAEQAHVAVLDHGFTVGDGVFETMRTAVAGDGTVQAFALDRHLGRLQRSAAGLGLAGPDPDVVARAVAAVCSANPQLRAGGRIRVTCTSGAGPLGSDRGGAPATLVVTAAPVTPWPPTARLAVSPWPRNERSPIAGLKTTSYAENVLMLAHARRLGAGEALLANLAGNLCEGTGSNVFVVQGGAVLTPPLASGCLAGITRELVLEWGADAGLPVSQAHVALADLGGATEVFLTSSTRDIHPVVSIVGPEGDPVWSGTGPGPLTARLQAVFAARAAEGTNP